MPECSCRSCNHATKAASSSTVHLAACASASLGRSCAYSGLLLAIAPTAAVVAPCSCLPKSRSHSPAVHSCPNQLSVTGLPCEDWLNSASQLMGSQHVFARTHNCAIEHTKGETLPPLPCSCECKTTNSSHSFASAVVGVIVLSTRVMRVAVKMATCRMGGASAGDVEKSIRACCARTNSLCT